MMPELELDKNIAYWRCNPYHTVGAGCEGHAAFVNALIAALEGAEREIAALRAMHPIVAPPVEVSASADTAPQQKGGNK